jgi:DNA-binding MarR family transcriptional regulator
MVDFRDLERFAKGISRGFHPAVSINVNRSEVGLLMMLSEEKRRPFKHYGSRLHMEKSSFSYIVDLLVLKELVIKVEDENDKRRKSIELTQQGKSIVDELKTQHQTYVNEKLSVFSKEELKELEEAVKVVKKLGEKLRQVNEREHDDRGHRDDLHRSDHPKGPRRPPMEYRGPRREHK